MELSSPRFKALAVTAGSTFWAFIVSNTLGFFSIEFILIFSSSVAILTQIFSHKLSKGLDYFAIFNTKIFLGSLFLVVFTLYGVLFKLLRIDLLRLQKNPDTYWLEMEELKLKRIFKQY